MVPPEEAPEEKKDYTDNSGKMSAMEKEEESQGVNPNSTGFQGYTPGAV